MDVEWRKVRERLTDYWNKQLSHNLLLAIDHRAFYFRHKERKRTLPRSLVQDILEMKRKQIPAPNLFSKCLHPTQNILTSSEKYSDASLTKPHISQPNMLLKLGQPIIHKALFHLILRAVEQSSLSRHDKKRITIFWHHFFAHFICLERNQSAFISFMKDYNANAKVVKKTDLSVNRQSSQPPSSIELPDKTACMLKEKKMHTAPTVVLDELSF